MGKDIVVVLVVTQCNDNDDGNEIWCLDKVLRVQGVRENSQRNKVRMRMKEFKFTKVKIIILRLFLNQCRI